MNSFEFNKIAAAILFSVLFVMVLGLLAGVIYKSEKPAKPGYIVEIPESETAAPTMPSMADSTPAPAETVATVSLADLLGNADAARGQKVAKKCAACHTLTDGGANKIGPNLFNVAGRAMGSIDGFRYSKAMQAQGADGAKWTYETLFGFLGGPKKFLKGTTMGFSGVKSEGQRADLVVFLKSISPDAPALP
ncbi:MAG: cytochrome c family protein [Hyphomicrobiales bacterium]